MLFFVWFAKQFHYTALIMREGEGDSYSLSEAGFLF